MSEQLEYREIPLTQGKVAIVDADDYDFLNQWKWYYSQGYAHRKGPAITKDGKRAQSRFLMHRIVAHTPQGMFTDHINGQPLDNRKANLRICTPSQNAYNKRCFLPGTTSKYKGVSWDTATNKWKAQNRVAGVLYYLGVFASEDDAATAYNMSALRHFRQFAKLNFIGGPT